MRKSVSIVGAGPGGPATAMMLAKAGLDVQVFERRDRAGGRTPAFNLDGSRFGLGPAFFLYPHALERILRMVGHTLSEKFRRCSSIRSTSRSILSVIFESARIGSRLLLRDFGMDSEWLTPDSASPVE